MSSTQKVKVQTCAYCACTVYMQLHFTTLWLSWLRSRFLTNPCQSDIWWLATTRRNSYNLYLSVSTITVPSWRRGFLSICSCLRTLLSQNITVSLCSHCKHNLYDCCEYPVPFSPEMMMIVIDRDTNICILNDILSKETERSTKACC